jgi:uncharacterized protein DUF4389
VGLGGQTTHKEGIVESSVVTPSGYAVNVQIPRPARTSRLLLFLRIILLIPQYLFLLVVGIAATVLVLINYVVVLITGRTAFFGFLSGVLRYGTRLTAYSYFLTDKYPPFSLGEAPDYPVQVEIEHPQKIHRWRVFSFILAFPHFLLLYGLLVLASFTSLVSFFIVLIFGRYPAGLFGIAAAAVRYQTRVNAYLYLIVRHYPPFTLGLS